MQLIIYTADCTGNAKNCKYPHRAVVTNEDELQMAVSRDHVCAEYQGNYRSVDNFISSNVVVMDCDNDHSESPAEWMTAEKLEEIFVDVAYGLAPSRQHLIEKGGKVSDAKLFLIKLQSDGRGYSSIHTIRGVLRPAFQMAVDDDVLHKNPFGFELAGVVVNNSVTREAVSKEQMRKFLKFVHDDNVYCKYYEVVYILFHTGMRISEFCGLTLKDLDMKNRIINIDHQLLRTSEMKYVVEATKTNAGTRKLPMTEDVFRCFQAIIEDRERPKIEKVVDGHSGFWFLVSG